MCMYVCLRFSLCLCCPVEAEVMPPTDPPSKESGEMSIKNILKPVKQETLDVIPYK
jgi:hypothetical protein